MTTADRRPLRMLLVEDAKSDYELILTLLAGAGFAVTAQKVEDEPALRAALAEHEWDLLISDHSPPRFSAHAALSTLQSTGLDIPFLIVSGSIGEDGAVQAMLAGADDCIMKSGLTRLVPAVKRALCGAEARRRRHEAEAELRASRAELHSLTMHFEKVKEAERARLAREIHDDIGGTLTGLGIDLTWLKTRFEQDADVMEKLESMAALVDLARSASVRIARDLQPPVLDLGLVAAIEWQARNFEKQTGARCRVRCEDREMPVEGARATAVFRIFQELLTNVTKHAAAKAVDAQVVTGGGVLVLEVRDDGCGIADADRRKNGHYGIRGMMERARDLGGRLDIVGRPGQGTTAVLSVPLSGMGA